MGRILPSLSICTLWGVHQDFEGVCPIQLVLMWGLWLTLNWIPRMARAPMHRFQETVQADIGGATPGFRDDSVGWWVEVNQMSVETTREGTTVRTEPHPLQGLGVELRRFGDGEILQIDQAEYWMGGEREEGLCFSLSCHLSTPAIWRAAASLTVGLAGPFLPRVFGLGKLSRSGMV